jgi:hypothetical protein
VAERTIRTHKGRVDVVFRGVDAVQSCHRYRARSKDDGTVW